MPTYRLNHAYEAYRDGRRFGPWAKGDTVNLDTADAQWVERDSAGALSEVAEQKPSGPAEPVPAAGASPRVGGDPGRVAAAKVAQERVHAEAQARQTPVEPEEEPEDEGERAKPAGRNRQHRGGRNRGA